MQSVAAPFFSLRKACRATFFASLTGAGLPLTPRRFSSFNKFDAVDYVGRSRNVSNAFDLLELNLFEDPTGGLTSGPAEELSTTDIENQARLYVASHDRALYYLLYTPFVDVVSVAIEQGLVPDAARPGEVMCRWFTDGVSTLQNPAGVAAAMGPETWRRLGDGLEGLYRTVEPVMPLTAAARKHGLPQEVLVPFLRQLAMEMLVPARRRTVLEILPGLILGLANGRAPAAFGFPTDSQRERAVITTDLFMGAGQETGNTDLAYLGIQLLRANDIPVPFPKQKQLTNVFSASSRIQTDWQMRVSGVLVEILPKWTEYYKKVHHDNLVSMRKLIEKESSVGETRKEEKEEEKKETKKQNSENEEARSLGNKEEKAEAVRKGKSSMGNKKKNVAILDDALETDPLTTSKAPADVTARDQVSDVHDYFSSHQVEDEMRLSAIEKTILKCVRERDEAWRDEEKQLPQRYRFGIRRRSPIVDPVKKERESEKRTKKEEEEGDEESDAVNASAEAMVEDVEDTPKVKAKPKAKSTAKANTAKQKRKASQK